jgi:hypothetical protein
MDCRCSELSWFIASGRLNVTIDRVHGVVETNWPPLKNAQTETVSERQVFVYLASASYRTFHVCEFVGPDVFRASLSPIPPIGHCKHGSLPMIPFPLIISRTPFVMNHIPTRPSPLPVVCHPPHLSNSAWQQQERPIRPVR